MYVNRSRRNFYSKNDCIFTPTHPTHDRESTWCHCKIHITGYLNLQFFAMITKEEKRRLNSEGAKIYIEAGIIPENDEVLAGADDFYDKILEINGVGFAHYYLYRYKVENRAADTLVYKQLIQIDSQLGTTESDQLYWCLENTTCPNLINVIIFRIITGV